MVSPHEYGCVCKNFGFPLFMGKNKAQDTLSNLEWCAKHDLVDHVSYDEVLKLKERLKPAVNECTCTKSVDLTLLLVMEEKDVGDMFWDLSDCLASGEIRDL